MSVCHETKANDPGLQIKIVSSIHDIEPVMWDSVNASQGLYWTHRFFSCVESAGIDDTSYWYVLFHVQDTLVATAVLSSFVVSLDLLLPISIQSVCNIIRRYWTSFFRLPILFCGVPVSIGKHTLAISDAVKPDIILKKLNCEMERIAAAQGIRCLCFKEYSDGDLPEIRILERLNYTRAQSIPRMNLELKWASYKKYLSMMRHGYRRMIRQSLKKLDITINVSPIAKDIRLPASIPRLSLVELNMDNTRQMYELYLEVMRCATTKLEILPWKFFEALGRKMRSDLALLGLVHKRKLLGAVLLGRSGTQLNFLFAGIDYLYRDQFQIYFNLLNGIIAYGIEQRFGKIDLGQTTYTIKQRLGGSAEPMYFYLRHLSTSFNMLIRLLNRLLFPVTKIQSRRVFRDMQSEGL